MKLNSQQIQALALNISNSIAKSNKEKTDKYLESKEFKKEVDSLKRKYEIVIEVLNAGLIESASIKNLNGDSQSYAYSSITSSNIIEKIEFFVKSKFNKNEVKFCNLDDIRNEIILASIEAEGLEMLKNAVLNKFTNE